MRVISKASNRSPHPPGRKTKKVFIAAYAKLVADPPLIHQQELILKNKELHYLLG